MRKGARVNHKEHKEHKRSWLRKRGREKAFPSKSLALRESFTHTGGLFRDFTQGLFLSFFFVFFVFFVVKKHITARPARDCRQEIIEMGKREG